MISRFIIVGRGVDIERLLLEIVDRIALGHEPLDACTAHLGAGPIAEVGVVLIVHAFAEDAGDAVTVVSTSETDGGGEQLETAESGTFDYGFLAGGWAGEFDVSFGAPFFELEVEVGTVTETADEEDLVDGLAFLRCGLDL